MENMLTQLGRHHMMAAISGGVRLHSSFISHWNGHSTRIFPKLMASFASAHGKYLVVFVRHLAYTWSAPTLQVSSTLPPLTAQAIWLARIQYNFRISNAIVFAIRIKRKLVESHFLWTANWIDLSFPPIIGTPVRQLARNQNMKSTTNEWTSERGELFRNMVSTDTINMKSEQA